MKITYAQITSMICELATKVRPFMNGYTNIVGIANGGLHVSRPLAAMLGCSHSSVRISHYDGSVRRAIPIVEGHLPQSTGNLIVDDLIDNGWTMQTFADHFGLEGNMTAVLFWKPGSFKPDFYVAEKPEGWVHFLWEVE